LLCEFPSEIGQDFEHELLCDGGNFVRDLAEMLRELILIKGYAEYGLQCALEYRLKQGGETERSQG